MSWQEDFAAARRADPEAPARLGAYLGPFVHSPYLARLSSIAAARATRARVTQALAALASGAEPAEAWMAKLLEETRTEAAALSLDPAQVQEHPDESIAGTEARRLLGQLSPMAPGDRELAILRLVEGIGASELGQVAGETEALGARLLDACRQALTLLGSQAPTGDDAYLLEPRLHAPTQAVVSVENHLEPLRYNEDQLPASALAPVAPLLLDPPPPPGFVWDDKEVTGTEVANPNETAQTRVNLPRALSQPVEVLTPPMGPPEAVPTARVPADVAGQTAV